MAALKNSCRQNTQLYSSLSHFLKMGIKAKIDMKRLMVSDITRKPKPNYSIAIEKLEENASYYNRDQIQKFLRLCTFNLHSS